MKCLHVSAGGKNVRLKKFLKQEFNGIPKHVLPLPQKKMTVIEAIIKNAEKYFDKIIIEANNFNVCFISPLFYHKVKVLTVIDNICSGPLGPTVRELHRRKKRIYGCAGDYYCDFSWYDFEKFHDSHDLPVSILISKSVPAPKGAKFNLNKTHVKSWERVKMTKKTDLINIGVYIIDPSEDILKETKKMTWHKEDVFFDKLIQKKLLAAYNPGGIGFNINTPVIFKSLCQSLNQGL